MQVPSLMVDSNPQNLQTAFFYVILQGSHSQGNDIFPGHVIFPGQRIQDLRVINQGRVKKLCLIDIKI